MQHTTAFKAWLDVYNNKFADNLFAWHKFNFNSPRRSSLIALCKPLETFPWNISMISSVESALSMNESSCSLVRWKTQMSERCLHIGIARVHINYLWLVKHQAILFYNFQALTFQDFSTQELEEGPGNFSSVLLEFTKTKETFVCACARIEKNLFEARENRGRFCSVLAWFRLHTFHVIFCELLKVDVLFPNDLQPVRHKEHLVMF